MTPDLSAATDLLVRYAAALDAGDFDGVGALFADGELCAGEGPAFASGAAEVAAFYRSTVQLHDGSPRTKHLVSGVVVDGSEVRSGYQVLQQVADGPLQTIVVGRYVDEVAPDAAGDGRWCFTRRRFFVDLVGDLSRHLADPSIAGR